MALGFQTINLKLCELKLWELTVRTSTREGTKASRPKRISRRRCIYIHICMCIYIYIYTHTYITSRAENTSDPSSNHQTSQDEASGPRSQTQSFPMSLLVWRYLSNTASFVLCVFRRVKDHHNLLHHSPPLKKACARQVVLDEWFPVNAEEPEAVVTPFSAGEGQSICECPVWLYFLFVLFCLRLEESLPSQLVFAPEVDEEILQRLWTVWPVTRSVWRGEDRTQDFGLLVHTL